MQCAYAHIATRPVPRVYPKATSAQSGPNDASTRAAIGIPGSRAFSASAMAAWPTYTQRRRRMRQSATVTAMSGSESRKLKPRMRSAHRLASPQSRSSASAKSTQEFGAERLRAHALHSVALAARCAPQLPHNEYTRTPCGVTSRRMGRDRVTSKESANGGAVGARRSERHTRHLRIRLIH